MIDTKHIAYTSPEIKEQLQSYSTGLGVLFERFNKKPFSLNPVISTYLSLKESNYLKAFPSKFGNMDVAGQHQAGYDAFLTGLVFLRMVYFLFKENANKIILNNSKHRAEFSKFENQLHQMRIRGRKTIKLST